jgi:ABC-type xylose transport system permease subunit
MVMVILSCGICLSLGACIGFVGAGLCAAASDNTQHRLDAEVKPIGTARESSKAR